MILPAREDAEAYSMAEHWQAVLWDDPVNMAKVARHVLIRVLGCDAQHATELISIPNGGSLVVAEGSHEDCHAIAAQIGSYGLWATMVKIG